MLPDDGGERGEYGGEFLASLPVPSRVFEDAAPLVKHVVDWLGGPPEPFVDAPAAEQLPLDLFALPGELLTGSPGATQRRSPEPSPE